MSLKLYGPIQSMCTQRVLTVVKELGIDIELVPIDFAKQEHKTKEYLETKQPFGVVPVLVSYTPRVGSLASWLVSEWS